MYAVLMSITNSASLISSYISGVVTYLLGITEDNFDNLWILILICNITLGSYY